MADAYWAEVLLSHLDGVTVVAVEDGPGGIRIRARTIADRVACPECGTVSGRVHSGYERRLADGAIGERAVEIRLVVRRFRCGAAWCGRATFVEQVDGLTFRYGRRSLGLQSLLSTVALMLVGRAGARLAEALRAPVSRSTLVRLIRALPELEISTPRVLGVDDFALRKGHVYGTLLVDVERRRPIDLLPTRESDALAAWLAAHPGIEIICRDRAPAYAEGARLGAPEAVQVADRWHIWHNLAEAIERIVARNASSLRPPPEPRPITLVAEPAPSPAAETPPHLAARIRRRHAAIHNLITEGCTIRQIAAELDLARNTVRRYARVDAPEQLITGQWQAGRPCILDPFAPYLIQRLAEGQHNATRLYEEITQLGYPGSLSRLRAYLRPLREGHPAPRRRPAPSVRTVTGWLTRHPDRLTAEDREELAALLQRCPNLRAAAVHVRAFAEMMRLRAGTRLNTWIRAVREDVLPELHSFAAGIEQDYDAVLAALTLPYSSGVVEGHVNRIIMWNLICQVGGRSLRSTTRCEVVFQPR